jgi:hypothetical protein
MPMGPGCSARRGEPSAPYFDLTGTLSRLCARRKVCAKMDSSEGLADGTVYRAHEIIVHGGRSGQKAGE